MLPDANQIPPKYQRILEGAVRRGDLIWTARETWDVPSQAQLQAPTPVTTFIAVYRR